MKYEYTVDAAKRRAYLTIRGKCGIRDLKQTLAAITCRDDFNPEHDQLTDLTECQFDFGIAELAEFATMYNKVFQGKEGSTAVLASSPREVALTMLHETRVSESRQVRLFSTREAASEWLSLDAGQRCRGRRN